MEYAGRWWPFQTKNGVYSTAGKPSTTVPKNFSAQAYCTVAGLDWYRWGCVFRWLYFGYFFAHQTKVLKKMINWPNLLEQKKKHVMFACSKETPRSSYKNDKHWENETWSNDIMCTDSGFFLGQVELVCRASKLACGSWVAAGQD